jgi:malate dehydrogenase (oxaloacetate-decarboxylating)(NADP+)
LTHLNNLQGVSLIRVKGTLRGLREHGAKSMLKESSMTRTRADSRPDELHGIQCLRDPISNRGTAFTAEERTRLGLEALLPAAVETLVQQAARAVDCVRSKTTAMEKYLALRALQDENETLFYRVVLDHMQELLPIVYTPTVGQACLEWSRNLQRPRGLYISMRHRGRIADILRQCPYKNVGVVVVTDGGRILGLGDLGANGMGIPIGKLALYTLCAGIAPQACLPVMLDVGTDNAALRCDPYYIGEREPRLTGEAYDQLLAEFIAAVQTVFPSAIVQFEDFNNACAFRLLQIYRTRLCCFDDDIQGTGAMGLAGLYSAGRIAGRRLSDERILFVGAGEACLGVGAMVVFAMQREGLSQDQARQRCLFFDSKGMVVDTRGDLPAHKRAFAQAMRPLPDLPAAVEAFRPTALIGACCTPGIFSRAVLEALARATERPLVLALSNPTTQAECTARDAYTWTEGRAIFASGSPSDPVTVGGRTHAPAQANNSYIFPGIGLGLLVSGATMAADDMFLAAARRLSAQTSEADLQQGRIFPPVTRMREVAATIAVDVAAIAHEHGVATRPRSGNLHAEVAASIYEPRYEADQ